ncbi:MAG: ABC transporter permease subunit [Spirochaetaceae bacterium]|jgi:thiamine transport system permease protein|nr:ABC transporter permease subunit [Spirochaetaceae bacterium]
MTTKKSAFFRHYSLLFALLPFAALCFFFVLPYIAALLPGLKNLSALKAPWIWTVTGWTAAQAALSTALSIVFALPAAALVSSRGFKHKALMRSVTAIPFALPPIIMALGFVLFWGNSGIVNRFFEALFGVETAFRVLYRPQAVIFCHACYNFPLIMRIGADAFEQIRASYSAVSWSLGANPLKTLVFVSIPLALPRILAASLLVFLYCFTSFAIVLLLGGAGRSTLAVEIFRHARVTLDFSSAGALALIETLIAWTVFALFLFLERVFCGGKSPPSPALRCGLPPSAGACPRNAPAFSPSTVLMLPILLLALGPVLAVIADSFFAAPSRASAAVFTLLNWSASGERLFGAFVRSAALAALSACFTLVLAFFGTQALCQREEGNGGFFRGLITLSAASSGVVLGLGISSFYGRALSGTVLMAAAAQALIALPFAFNSVYGALRALPPSIHRQTLVFGASPLRRAFFELPLISTALRSAFGFSACISLGELNTIIMLGVKNYETMPLFIYRAAGAYRYGEAAACGALLVAASFLALRVSEARGSMLKRSG